MRVFIGIELTKPTKEAIFDVQQQLIPASKKGRFTDKDNFHLTLQFIGEANQKEIEQLKNAIAETAAESTTFEVAVEMLDKFQKKKGLILWAGPKATEPLLRLYDQLHTILRKQAITIEKQSYTPHITLGRNIVWEKGSESSLLQPLVDPIPVQIDNLTLFESVRVNGCLIYRPFMRYSLNNPDKSAERKEGRRI